MRIHNTDPKGFLNLGSPWQEVETAWSKEAQIRLHIKRDDLIHPLISGNKWRKLLGYLECYQGIREIWTFGGAYSNHLIATAALCHQLGIDSTAFVRGEKPKRLSTVLERCQQLGMRLSFCPREEYIEMKREEQYDEGILTIPEGGAGQKGIRGCAEILSENGPQLDYCAVACGTGTTLAGMALSAREKKLSCKIIGVPVLKEGEHLMADINQWVQGASYELWTEFHGGGYAKTNTALMEFMDEFAEQSGILLDPIYTGKLFYAAKIKALKGEFKKGSQLGLIHTGGLTGWYGKWTEAIKKDPSQRARV